MKPGITNLSVEGFRALQHLTITGLGRVNLITGRNNTGKSSVLEALRLLTSDASLSIIFSILSDREEDISEIEEVEWRNDADSLFQLASLFSGFPQLTDPFQPITIRATGDTRSLDMVLGIGWVSRTGDADSPFRLIERQNHVFEEDAGLPALIIESSGIKRLIPMNKFRHRAYSTYRRSTESREEPPLRCRYVSPYGGEKTFTLGTLWDSIALSDQEKNVVEALRIIDPDISAVSMVGGEGARQRRTAIVRSSKFERPVPLRSFGDGLNRLFGIVLSLVNAKNGILLIDEFENGMHHSVQFDAWRAIFRLAQNLGVQVFATSHSWDAIEAFQKAAAETPEQGVLVRLSRRENRIIPTLFREDELAVATRDRIEVR